MEIEVKEVPKGRLDSICDVEKAEIKRIKDLFSTIKLEEQLGPSTKQIETKLLPILKENGWELNFKFDSSTASIFPTANYTLDAIKNISDDKCSHKHRFLLELCFDNRQAIGTNLLKFQAATRKFETEASNKAISILVCGERSALVSLNWDGGVASHSEYENALRTVYKDLFNFNLAYLVVRGN